MEQSNAPVTPVRTGFLTTLCILSYIGSGLWALFSLIGIFASGMIMSWFGGAMSQAKTEVTSNMNMSDSATAAVTERLDNATAAVDSAAGMATGMVIGVFVFSLLLAVLSLMGVMKMWKLKKSGFWMYTIANGIWMCLGIYLAVNGIAGWAGPVLTAAFIGMYGMNLKNMR
jgi:hypothetical protein